MARLFIFAKTVMDIVSSEYIETNPPKEINRETIRAIVIKKNTDFEELKVLDRYDMKMVSDGKQFGAVLWDPKNKRKLIQDLRCTLKLDDPAWQTITYGNEFTLNWEVCPR
ncbi:MAG: hypothetical protein HQL10_12260 [Nitrospirae bacterium]|nr:hypothetical protein [Nitrospirota bacterium]